MEYGDGRIGVWGLKGWGMGRVFHLNKIFEFILPLSTRVDPRPK